jgi:predicted transposase/invertase (TIGR01784 family)
MRSRISHYLSNLITEQIGSGGHYSDLKQAIIIVITDYDFIPESKKCHTAFGMNEKEEHFPFNDLMEIHVLNLPRLSEVEEGYLSDWLKFLKAESEEEFKMLAIRNPVINEAYSKLQVISADEGTRRLYEARLRACRDEYARIQGARQDGWQDGLDEGRRERDREIARNLKAIGIPASQIAMGTGLSIDEIAKL